METFKSRKNVSFEQYRWRCLVILFWNNMIMLKWIIDWNCSLSLWLHNWFCESGHHWTFPGNCKILRIIAFKEQLIYNKIYESKQTYELAGVAAQSRLCNVQRFCSTVLFDCVSTSAVCYRTKTDLKGTKYKK